MANWVERACWWLTPLYDLVVSTVLSSGKLFVDDTTLPVLDPGRGRTKTGRLWCYAVDVDPMAWLTDVLERMVSGQTKTHQLDTLVPWNWVSAAHVELAAAA